MHTDSLNIIDADIVDLLKVDPNKTWVYIADMDKYIPYMPHFWSCLSTKEKQQAKKYYTKLLADRYIISHGILRHILSYYTKQAPKNLEFGHTKYGKPFLNHSNIQFNMSHSGNMVCYGVAINYKVGIDIEYHDDNLDVMGLSDLVLTPQEIIFLKSSEERRNVQFFIGSGP